MQLPDLDMQQPLAFLISRDCNMVPRRLSNTAESSAGRQTRRRTSPEDQAILEAAFKENPKPDKTARAELASRVSLGERELSIWFQNKRQVSRRRSRPLTSDEIFPTMSSSQDSFVSASCCSVANSQEQLSSQSSTTSIPSQTPSDLDRLNPSSGVPDNTLSDSNISHPNTLVPLHDGVSYASKSLSDVPKDELNNSSAPPSDIHVDPFSLKLKTTSTSKKQRGAPFDIFPDFKSQPRLSTSLSGSVRIKTGASPSPSPPRSQSLKITPQPRVPGPLQRSQSAMVTSSSLSGRPTASFGRSKDSRSWQFFCDPIGGDELSRQAELEQKGSAAGAINLLRCKSKESLRTSAITGNSNKRTATSAKLEGQKRAKKEGESKTEKPKLARTTSSGARLQNPSTLTSKNSNPKHSSQDTIKSTNLDKDSKKKATSISIFADGNESDKENWAPGTDVPVPSRRRRNLTNGGKTSRANNVLRENPFMSSQSTSLNPGTGNAGNSRGRRAAPVGKENTSGNADEEVERFMSSGNVIIGEDDDEEEDLSCVQGLLSLSQGAWR